MKRRVCITTGIGITTLTAEDSRPATQSNLLEAPNSYEYALNPIQWIDLLGLQRSKGCPNALEDAKREAARLRAIGGKLPTATCAMVNRRTGKIYTGTSETNSKTLMENWELACQHLRWKAGVQTIARKFMRKIMH